MLSMVFANLAWWKLRAHFKTNCEMYIEQLILSQIGRHVFGPAGSGILPEIKWISEQFTFKYNRKVV